MVDASYLDGILWYYMPESFCLWRFCAPFHSWLADLVKPPNVPSQHAKSVNMLNKNARRTDSNFQIHCAATNSFACNINWLLPKALCACTSHTAFDDKLEHPPTSCQMHFVIKQGRSAKLCAWNSRDKIRARTGRFRLFLFLESTLVNEDVWAHNH